MAVIWRDILGFEGYYQAGTNGEIRSVDRKVDHPKHGKMKVQGVILKPALNGVGYLGIAFSKEGKTKTYAIHRLVLETFTPNTEGKEQVNHMNADKTCNELWNLEWSSRTENMVHAHENNLIKYNAKALSDDQADMIRSEYIPGSKHANTTSLAKKYGVSRRVIQNVINRKGAYADKPQPTAPRNTFPNWEKYA